MARTKKTAGKNVAAEAQAAARKAVQLKRLLRLQKRLSQVQKKKKPRQQRQ